MEQNPTIELGGHQKNVNQHVQPKEQLVKPNGHAGPETGSKTLMVFYCSIFEKEKEYVKFSFFL